MKIHNNTEKPIREEIWCLQKIGYVVAGFRISSHIVRFSWFLFLKHPFFKNKIYKGKIFQVEGKIEKLIHCVLRVHHVCVLYAGWRCINVGSTHVRFASIFIILWREKGNFITRCGPLFSKHK